jgi:TraB family protein
MNGRTRSIFFPTAALFALLMLASSAIAQSAGENHPTIEEITVIGRYPGPPLWKVTSGARTLWVFGELSPVPKGLEWDPRNAERVLDRAAVVIGSPRVSAMTLNPIRVFKLYRGARRLVRLPDDATLADQMPPELYARYVALRMRYLPKIDEGDEEVRPALAVLQLYRAALDDTGLTSDSGVGKTIARKMRRSKAEEADVVVETEPEAVLDGLKKITPEAELDCFEAVLTSIETDLGGMKERANAWAVGDVEALKRFDYPDSQGNCLDALATVEDFADLRDELYRKWLSEAEHALATYDTSFSVLPMWELVADTGLLAQLAARGYTVTAP